MKKRIGFVSNSSSTSFCIVGVKQQSLVDALWLAEGNEEVTWESVEIHNYLNWGEEIGEHISFYGSYEDNPYYAGVCAKDVLETMTLTEAYKWFAQKCKEWYNISIPIGAIGLLYGEAGNS